jgi:hypothetical protein
MDSPCGRHRWSGSDSDHARTQARTHGRIRSRLQSGGTAGKLNISRTGWSGTRRDQPASTREIAFAPVNSRWHDHRRAKSLAGKARSRSCCIDSNKSLQRHCSSPLSFEIPEEIFGWVELAVEEPVPLRAILEFAGASRNDFSVTIAETEEDRLYSSRFGESGRPLAVTHMTRYYTAN